MKLYGIGYGSMMYGVGYGFARPDYGAADIEIAPDGSLTIWSGCSELGQGLITILSQIASQELGIPYKKIRVFNADTALTPDSGPVSASRSTFVQGAAIVDACNQLKDVMLDIASKLLQTPIEDLLLENGFVKNKNNLKNSISIDKIGNEISNRGLKSRVSGWYSNTTVDVDSETSQGDAFSQYAWASQMASVEVDLDTGKVKVITIISSTDAGKAVNPQLVEGQIEGGVIQGVGYALFEEMKVVNGEFLNASLSNYIIPTSADSPEIISLIVEIPDPFSPHGVKGVGEPAMIPTAPAILNAINNAIGKRICVIPATPERILAATGKIPEKRNENTITIDMIPYPEP